MTAISTRALEIAAAARRLEAADALGNEDKIRDAILDIGDLHDEARKAFATWMADKVSRLFV